MRIFVCPISGGAFPVQIGFIAELTSLGIKPDIIMGSSGGNIAAYIGLASQWNPKEMDPIVNQLKSSMFALSWWPSYLKFLPSWLIGYFKGSIYAEGTGAINLFREIFTPENISSTEIWTGTMNQEEGKGQLFCNQKREEAIIQELDSNRFWTRDYLPLTYVGNDIDFLALVSIASASIPIVVPAKVIDGQRFVDGGISFASPLSLLHEQIRELSLEEPIHIDYLSSFDMQNITPSTASSLYDNGTITIGELVKSLCIEDRLTALEFIRLQQIKTGLNLCFYSGEFSQENFCEHSCEPSLKKEDYEQLGCKKDFGTKENLMEKIEQIRKKSPSTILELSPIKNDCINLLNFQSKDIFYLMDQTRQRYKIRFWWLGSSTEDLDDVSVTKANDFRGSLYSSPVFH